MARSALHREFFVFLKRRKLLWLVPVGLILLGLVLLVLLTEYTAVLPFIYS